MKPNILFLVIDSFRADKCFGHNKTSQTPNIDSLIKKGIYFDQAISSSDGTFTSLGSIFTGLYPFQSGVSTFSNHSKTKRLFDILKTNGYHIYGTMPDQHFWKTISQDFDDKDLTTGLPYLRLFEGAGNLIKERLESNNLKEPWIYYVHVMDLHVHRLVPAEFNHEKYGKDEYERRISSIDFWLGKILSKIDFDKTIVVLTSDHGDFVHDLHLHAEYIPRLQQIFRKIKLMSPKFLEPFGVRLFVLIRSITREIRFAKLKQTLTTDEMRTLTQRGNGPLYDEVLCIPLIFCGYGIPSSRIIHQQVRQIDILPTITELTSLANIQGKISGRSLVPFFNGQKMEELSASIESIPHLDKSEGKTIGVRTSQYKYYRSRNNPRDKISLFDLKNDPQEKNNIAYSRPELVEKMEKILTEIRHDSVQDIKKEEELSDEETKMIQEELKKLGYI